MRIFTVFYSANSANLYIVVFVYFVSTRGDVKGYYSILELNTYSARYTSFWKLWASRVGDIVYSVYLYQQNLAKYDNVNDYPMMVFSNCEGRKQT